MSNAPALKLRRKQRGQGMTEYIIIVALIAIGAIGVYTAFGDVVRGQTGTIASSLGGATNATATALRTSGTQAAGTASTTKSLQNYETGNTAGGGGGQ